MRSEADPVAIGRPMSFEIWAHHQVPARTIGIAWELAVLARFSYLELFPLRSPFFGRAAEIGPRRSAKEALRPKRACSSMISPRRTTRSVKSSPGGHAS